MSRALEYLLYDDPNEFRGVVYFIEGSSSIKVGFTTALGKRLADLRTGSAESLSLMDYARAGKDVEAELHKILASERLSGEWFAFTDKTEDLIYLISDFLETFDDEDDRLLDGRDTHILTVDELRHLVANPYFWRADE
jgi:hypothetical protein